MTGCSRIAARPTLLRAALLLLAIPGGKAIAADYEVGCSAPALVSAVTSANVTGGSIGLTAGCDYTFSASTSENSALPPIVKDITIEGRDARITRSVPFAGEQFRHFIVRAGASLTLKDLTLVLGNAPGGAIGSAGTFADSAGPGGAGQHGGSIHNSGTVVLDHVTIDNSRAGKGGEGGACGSFAFGVKRGGARGGQGGDGGAIWNSGSLTVRNRSVLRGNEAGAGGNGGTCQGGERVNGGDGWYGGHGGAIFNALGGTVTLTQTTLFRNAAGHGGDAGQGPAPDDGSDPHNGSGGHGGSGGGVMTLGGLTIENGSIEKNFAGDGGSSIFNSRGSDTPGGNGGNGGGLSLQSGTMAVRRTTINRNGGGRGGQSRLDLDGEPGGGGGIYANASASIENSTIAENDATPTGCVDGGDGGGLLVGSAGTVDLRNTAVTGNNPGSVNCSRTGGALGKIGGIKSLGTVRLWNSILNSGVFVNSLSSGLCSGNIIDSTPSANQYWHATSTDAMGRPPALDCPATLIKQNPVYTAIAASPDAGWGRDPALGSEPVRPGPASGLVNAAQSSTSLSVDQRSVARPQGAASDIGPFETRILVTTHPSPVSVNAPTAATFSAQADTEGFGAPRVQWQTRTFGDWTNTGSETTATLVAGDIYRASLSVSSTSAADNGRSYRAVFKNTAFPGGVPTNAAVLTVQYMAITSNLISPPPVPVGSDYTLSFDYIANPRVGEILYEVSKDNGASWANAFVGTTPGATNGPLTIGLTATDEMYQATAAGKSWRYRATLSGGLAGRTPLVTSVAIITVNNDPAAPTVRVQGLNNLPEGEQNVIVAIVSGNPSPTIGWQVSTDAGVSWTDLVPDTDGYTFRTTLESGNNQAALFFQSRAYLDGYLYRPYVFNTTAPERRYGNPTTFRTRVRTTTSLSCVDQAFHAGTVLQCYAQVTANPLYPPLRRTAAGDVRLRITLPDGNTMAQACTLVGGGCSFDGNLGNFLAPTTITVQAFYPATVLEFTDQNSVSEPQSILLTDCLRPVITVRPTVTTLHAAAGECSVALPDYTTQTTATARDCAVTITQSPAPGTVLPIGLHTVIITATSAGGSVTQDEIVNIVDDELPVFSFEGAPPLQVTCGANVDLSVTVTDGCDGTQTVGPSGGSFNPYENGVYTLIYRFGDRSGNVATASRLVEVTGAPVPRVTLSGPAEMMVSCGAPFNDPGATATGQCGAPLQVTVTGSVNTAVAGTYILTYSAQGPSGELTATRSVNVTSCRAETTTTVVSSANPSVYGQPVTLTAQVRSNVGTPAGDVFMTYDNGPIPPRPLVNGDASFDPPLPISVGTHTLSVEFRETPQYLGSSTPQPFQQVVDRANTTITLSSSAMPAVFGQAIAITPSVAIFAPGAGTLTGTLSISIDGGPAVVQSDLTAAFSANGLSVGDHTISVTYSGDANFNGSTTVMTQTVNKASSATAVVSSKNPSTTSDAVTFTATVNIPTPGAGSPTGNVTFRASSTTLGIVALDGQFSAQYTTTFVAGTHSITAEYSGNTTFLGSTSNAISQVVTSANRAPTANAQSIVTPEDTALPITLSGSDADGDALTFAVATQPANGTLSGTAPNVTYTPNANYNGADSFTFTANDGTVASAAATVAISVTPANDAPTANAQSIVTPEDTALPITLSGSDADGDALTFAVATQPTNGTLSGTAPNVTYTPNANYNGADSFTFTANDGTVASAAATVAISVTAANDAPTATAQSIVTPEDAALPITLSGSDADGDALTFAVATQPTNGTLSGTAPNVTYTPNANYNGADSFTFTANDGTVASVAATVSISVTPANDAPTANAQSIVTPEDTALPITLSGSDPDGDTLTFAVVTQPANGTLSGTAPNVTYTPNANYNGADSFTFTASDGTVASAAATVSISVTPANDAPTANAQSIVTPEDTALPITLSGSDPDGDTLTFAVVTQPANGTLSGTAPNVTYTPNANYNGADSFTFTANDGTVASAAATVAISVTAANDAPTANPQSIVTPEDAALPITLSGSDADGDALTFAVATQPTNGTLSGTAPNVTYTPNANYNGADSFTFTASDGTVASAAATVSISVTAGNDAPTATAQSIVTPEDTALPITLSGSDADGDALTFAVATQPTNGTLSGTAPNVTYTPNANYNGADSFTFTANDGTVASAAATVAISVTAANDAPTANAQSIVTPEDTALPITLSGSDADGDALTFAVVTQPANGTLSGTAPNVTYLPNANYNGADSFTFTANDGTVASAAATVSISVTPANDAPTANAQSIVTPEDTALPITLSGSDADGDALTFAVVTQPANGTLSGSGANLTYLPNANFSGGDSFTFAANDGTVASAPATVSITVSNTPPALTAMAPSTACQGSDGFTLTVDGSNFVPGSTIRWNGADQATSFVGSTRLTAVISAIDLSIPGSATITIIEPNGATSNAQTFTVTSDSIAPAVTAPTAIVIPQTDCSPAGIGTTAASSPALAEFLAGDSATENCSTATRLPPQVDGADVTTATLFPGGVTSVTFRYRDGAGNIGTATSSVTVALFGDVNSDGAVDANDLLILANYLVGNLRQGIAPFTSALTQVDLNRDGKVDAVDLTIMAHHLVRNLECLPTP